MRQLQNFISMVMFLVITLGALAYVMISLNDFNDKLNESARSIYIKAKRTYVARK